ncbi:hypothetical protein S40285_06047 [Stachybotrys chlorohalonatus IBT 40285]|uniref:Uncharacterized protein n=1 Tax=Stachybotrys chlorohalonatus (strain IBT 40285) TaxID=1283841 RepID=A0A084Q8P9_STAC4|nr:hypothetical protein S40285_06047 [Stachybotrys chlorohalonata IBT 40285]
MDEVKEKEALLRHFPPFLARPGEERVWYGQAEALWKTEVPKWPVEEISLFKQLVPRLVTPHARSVYNHKLVVSARAKPSWAALTCLKIIFGWVALQDRRIGRMFLQKFPNHDCSRNEYHQVGPGGKPAVPAPESERPKPKKRIRARKTSAKDQATISEDEGNENEAEEDRKEDTNPRPMKQQRKDPRYAKDDSAKTAGNGSEPEEQTPAPEEQTPEPCQNITKHRITVPAAISDTDAPIATRKSRPPPAEQAAAPATPWRIQEAIGSRMHDQIHSRADVDTIEAPRASPIPIEAALTYTVLAQTQPLRTNTEIPRNRIQGRQAFEFTPITIKPEEAPIQSLTISPPADQGRPRAPAHPTSTIARVNKTLEHVRQIKGFNTIQAYSRDECTKKVNSMQWEALANLEKELRALKGEI